MVWPAGTPEVSPSGEPGHRAFLAAVAAGTWQPSAGPLELTGRDHGGQPCPICSPQCFALTNATGATWVFSGNPSVLTAHDLEGLFALPCASLVGMLCSNSVRLTAPHGKDALYCHEVLNGRGAKCPGPITQLRAATNSTPPVPAVARVEGVWGMEPPQAHPSDAGGYGDHQQGAMVGDAGAPGGGSGHHGGHDHHHSQRTGQDDMARRVGGVSNTRSRVPPAAISSVKRKQRGAKKWTSAWRSGMLSSRWSFWRLRSRAIATSGLCSYIPSRCGTL